MPKESSVAPKERVNIVYRPATGDASEEVELPLKVLVMGDFTMREDETPLEDLSPDEEDAKMTVSLDFKSLRDFEPDEIIKKVPELNKLIDLREALKALKGPLGNVPDFRKKIQELIKDDGAKARLLKELGIEE